MGAAATTATTTAATGTARKVGKVGNVGKSRICLNLGPQEVSRHDCECIRHKISLKKRGDASQSLYTTARKQKTNNDKNFKNQEPDRPRLVFEQEPDQTGYSEPDFFVDWTDKTGPEHPCSLTHRD